jgi:hypothetical protein
MTDHPSKPAQRTPIEANRGEETLRARHAVIEEIRTELKTQSGLKKDILNDLKPTSLKTQLLEWSKHPVLLLLLGSALGGWLSSCYQKREWNRQQGLLAEKQKIEKKISMRDEVTDSIIEAYGAAETAVRPFFYENAATFAAAEKDREKEWAEASKKWQHARLKLRQKLDLYFTDPNIKNKFMEIIDSTNQNGNSLFVEVNNALGAVKSKPAVLDESVKPLQQQSPEYIALKERIRANVLAMTTQAMVKTRELRDLMQQEIEKESKEQ